MVDIRAAMAQGWVPETELGQPWPFHRTFPFKTRESEPIPRARRAVGDLLSDKGSYMICEKNVAKEREVGMGEEESAQEKTAFTS